MEDEMYNLMDKKELIRRIKDLQETINCGQRLVQHKFRITLMDICKRNNINEGDVIEVFIQKVG